MVKDIATSDAPESFSEQVLVCPRCGSTNPQDAAACRNCWLSLTGVNPVAEREGERLARRRRRWRQFLRIRTLLLVLALLLGWVVWRVFLLYDLGPLILPPSGATTAIAASTGPSTWSQRGRTPQNTSFTPEQAPVPRRVKWAFSTGMEWVYAASRSLVSPPAVVDGRVYISTEDGRTVALDEETGRSIWEYTSGSPSGSAPAVAGDMLVVGLRPGRVISLARETGELRWQRDLKSLLYAAPIVVQGTVYVGAIDGNVYALDVATGDQRWSFATAGQIVARVAYADRAVVVVSEASSVNIVDARTGRRRFFYDTERRRNPGGGVAVQGDVAYLNSSGGIIWAIDRRAITYPLDGFVFYWKLKLYEARVYSRVPVQRGSVWARRIGGEILGTPAVTPDTVYISNQQGKVFARDAASGQRRWTTDLGVEITSSPTVAGVTVLVGTKDGIVFGLDTRSGQVMWDFKVGSGEIAQSPIVVGNTIYVVSNDGKLYAITGAE